MSDALSSPLFGAQAPCALIGMIHLRALPGSPKYAGSLQQIYDAAMFDADALIQGGCDALLVENMHDLPYLRGHVYPETVAAMAIATSKITALGKPTGVQVLAAANREAIGVALSAGAQFVRVEAFAYGHVADEGWLDACAGELLRTRASLGADHIKIFADVQKKHAAHAVTADLSIADLAQGSAFSGADGLIITGISTGAPTNPEHVAQARCAGLPVLVGSGVNPDNLPTLAKVAQGLIVGSWIKQDGDWRKPVDPARVRTLRTLLDA